MAAWRLRAHLSMVHKCHRHGYACLLLRRGCHNSPMLPSTLLPPNVCHGDLARNGERFGPAVYIVFGRARCRYCCNSRLSTSPPTPSVALCMSLITRGDSTRNVIEEEEVQSTMSVCLQQASSRQHKQPRSNGTLPTGHIVLDDAVPLQCVFSGPPQHAGAEAGSTAVGERPSLQNREHWQCCAQCCAQ